MKVGVFRPSNLPESFDVCIDNIVKHASTLDVEFLQTTDVSILASVDVIWDPRAGGGHAPSDILCNLGKPLVVTLHGIGPMMFPEHYSVGFRHRLKVLKDNRNKKLAWKGAEGKFSHIVTVSEFSKRVINQYLNIDNDKISVIYNGVDTSVFNHSIIIDKPNPYFLHVSNDESRKNVDRIIKAYSKIKNEKKWPLILKLSSKRTTDVDKVEIINKRLDESELSNLYKGAGVFLFPSIYEGFGIPIIEAMASYCPVITSAETACEEVAEGHGILVDPNSVNSLKQAMIDIMETAPKAESLVLAERHAKSYKWEKASRSYYSIFREVLDKHQD
jgi:glycosyltransferase involved in cell wall biosynthesis|tara:strand:- start:717 stop:1709 length:993 start_codon:yes stop_codon:yes gene_type:complete